MTKNPIRPFLIGLALISLTGSFLLSWLLLTPLGFGADWNGIAPTWTAKLVFFAPPIALAVGSLVWRIRRSPMWASAIFVSAPVYQAANIVIATFVLRSGS